MVEGNKNSSDQAEAFGARENNSNENEQHNDQKELLPPRSKVHLNKKTKFKFKIQYPLVRLLTIVFLLVVFLIPGYSIWKQNAQRVDGPATQTKSEQAFEDVEVEKSRMGEEKKSGFENREKPDANEIEEDHSDTEKSGETTSYAGNGDGMDGDAENDPQYLEKQAEQEKEKSEETTATEGQSTGGKPSLEEQDDFIIHVVQEGETLYRVSMTYFNSRAGEEKIKQANNLQENKIYEGQRLKIPKK